jgi:hypothetical protein
MTRPPFLTVTSESSGAPVYVNFAQVSTVRPTPSGRGAIVTLVGVDEIIITREDYHALTYKIANATTPDRSEPND